MSDLQSEVFGICVHFVGNSRKIRSCVTVECLGSILYPFCFPPWQASGPAQGLLLTWSNNNDILSCGKHPNRIYNDTANSCLSYATPRTSILGKPIYRCAYCLHTIESSLSSTSPSKVGGNAEGRHGKRSWVPRRGHKVYFMRPIPVLR